MDTEIDKAIIKNIYIDKEVLENIDIDIDIDNEILENINIDIDIDMEILANIDIDKILNRLEFGISNRASSDMIFVKKVTRPEFLKQKFYTKNA